MVRTLITILCVHAAGVAQDRTLASFVALSRQNLADRSVAELSGYDPVRDRDFHLWVQRAAARGFRDGASGPLFLHGVRRLSEAEARRLSGWGGRVFLPDLTELDTPHAEMLVSGSIHELHLDGLASISAATAKALSGWRGGVLSLGGLTTVTPDLAGVLSEFSGSLALDGITQLDADAADALARWDGYGEKVFLSLDGLATPSPEALERLARCGGWGLSLGALRRPSAAQAATLAKVRCAFLRLDGAIEVPLETARAMSRWKRKFLSLDGLRRIDDETRRLIEKGCESVSFDGLGPDQRPPYRLAPPPTARYEQLVVGHGFELFVVGGNSPGRSASDDLTAVEIYDVSLNQWRRGAALPSGRYFLSGGVLDGCIYAFGGEARDQSTVHRYRVATDRWDTVASQPTPRTHAAAVAARDRLWVIGGWRRQERTNLTSVEVYHPASDTWSQGPPLPTAIHGHAAAAIGDSIHVLGGDETPRRHLVLEGERWVERAPVPIDVIFAEAVSIGGRLYVLGGAPEFTSLHCYDPHTDRWEKAPAAPNPRYHFAAAAVDGCLYALGGMPVGARRDTERKPTLDRFDPARGAWYR